MDIDQAINKSKEYFQELCDIQEILFSNNISIQDIKTNISPYLNSRERLLPILFILNEIGFSRPYPTTFFNELFCYLSPHIRSNFNSDEVASIFSKSTKNYIPLFHYGCINIQTIINRSYLSEGIFKMFHIVIEKQDPVYYQIMLQKGTRSLKTFIQKKDVKSIETVNAIQNDNYEHVQTVTSLKNLNASSKIPFASSQINDSIKYAWQMPSMLEYAAMQGSLDTFKFLLLNGGEVTESLGNFAVRGGNYDIIHILEREKHVQFNQHDLITAVKYNRNELADYIVNNYNQKHSLYSLFEAVDDYNVRYLFDHFGLFDELNVVSGPKKVPINWVEMWHQKKALLNIVARNGFIDLVDWLLCIKNVDINIKSASDGFSPLHEATFSGFLNVVQLLVDKGANLNQLSYNDETPLHIACSKGHFEIVKFLIEKEEFLKIQKKAFNLKDRNGDTPLHLAARNGFDSIVKYLLDIDEISVVNDKNKNNSSPLTCAINSCRIHVVEALCCSEKVDVNMKESNNSPLQIAVGQNVLPIVKVIVDEAGDRLDINASNLFNTNALQQALKSGYNEIALFLLDNPKIDISVKNNDNRNILSYASETGNIQVVKKIIEILSMKKDKMGDENNNSNIDDEIDNNKTCGENNKNENNDNKNNTDNGNNKNNDDEENKDNFEINENNNDNNNNYSAELEDIPKENNEKCNKNCFDINDTDFFGQTALHLAAKNGHFEIMQLLIDIGIDKFRKNTVLSYAFFNNISLIFFFGVF